MNRHHPQNPLSPEEYAKLTGFDGKWRDTWWKDDFLRLILDRTDAKKPETLLDVGCGAGHWGRTLSRVIGTMPRVSGVDLEPKFIEKAVDLGTAFRLREPDYRVGKAEALPYEDDSFDLVTCQTVLIHIAEPAVVLKELLRVTKPGGLLLVAEPNNLTGFFNGLLAEPRLEWPVITRLLDFYHTCVQGKKALGMGDSSIGENLPGLISQAGFQNVQVSINENTPSLVPPYGTEVEQIQAEFLKTYVSSAAWIGFGTRENTSRFYEAGKGDASEFDRLWDLAISSQLTAVQALRDCRYSGARGPMMYLISARRP